MTYKKFKTKKNKNSLLKKEKKSDWEGDWKMKA
jgi:hypothetical protein